MSEWISVKERLPKPFVSVLVFMPSESPHPTVHEGFITADGIWVSGRYIRKLGKITHWMPLPAPPMQYTEKSIKGGETK